MNRLTKAEEQIMHIIWELEECSVKEILQQFPEPKPAVTTVSTIVRILEQKKFLDHKAYGRSYNYFPLVQKQDYSRNRLGNFVNNYFQGSTKALVSFLVKEKNLNLDELNEIINDMDSDKNEKS